MILLQFFIIFILNLNTIHGAQEKATACRGDLTMNVLGLNNDEGQIKFDLASSSESFKVNYKGEDLIIQGTSAIHDKKVVYVFKNIPCGDYAIQTYHDENMNQTLDFKFLKIPKEQYGFSNCKGCVLPPKWEVAKFTFDKEHNEVIVDLN